MEALAGDTAFVWKHRFERAYARMFALETAFVRRLLVHNAGDGAACVCTECTWLRSLFDARLAERLTAESERMVIVSNDFEAAARRQLQQLDQDQAAAEEAIAAAVAARDAVKRERDALTAALQTYERVRAGGRVTEPTTTRRTYARSAQTGREFLEAWAAAHGGLIATAEAIPASHAAGLSPHAAKKAALDRDVFARVSLGVYRVIAPADQGAA